MTPISRTPAYNLKAVLKETGLTADALRAWEKRYGLPVPERTPGGHRLYSDYDIQTVKWLRARQAEGLSISRAVELWRELTSAGRDPLEETPPTPPPAADSPAVIELHRRAWLEACLAFDETSAEEALNQAFAVFPVQTVVSQVLRQGLNEIGQRWQTGQASVQQEHFASELAVRRLETLITATPRPTREQSVLVGCPPGEWHTFPVLLLNLLLRQRGLGVVYLGASIPTQRLEETAAAIRPSLVVLAAQQLTSAAALRSAAEVVRRQGLPLAFGGLIFTRVPALRERIPGFYLGDSLEDAARSVERLLYTQPALPPLTAPDQAATGPEANGLAARFEEGRAQIEHALFEAIPRQALLPEHIRQANAYFGDELSAALELGDLAFLEADLEWTRSMLPGQCIPPRVLNPYLDAYRRAVRDVLGEGGEPIAAWLEAYLARTQDDHAAA